MGRVVRVGFVLGDEGFAAVLYTRTTQDATKRSPWTPDVAQATAWGAQWGERLGVPVDIVRVSTAFLEQPLEGK